MDSSVCINDRMLLKSTSVKLNPSFESEKMARVTVTVSGPTGSGKSRIALEIEVALRAAGIKVEWSDIDGQRQMEAEAHAEAHGGYQPELPEVLLQEINTPISIAEGFRRLNH